MAQAYLLELEVKAETDAIRESTWAYKFLEKRLFLSF